MVKKSFDVIFLVAIMFALASCYEKKEANVDERKKNTRKVSIEEIELGIKNFIEKKTEENDGYFHVHDRGQEFRMKLVRVHTEYLANLGPKSHFACVDLADERGDVYDVDFFLNGE